MAVRTRIEPLERDIQLILDEELSPAARSAAFAAFAQDAIDEAKDTNQQATGIAPKYTVYVDGRKGAALSSVKPDGVVVAEFDLALDAIRQIADMINKNSPVLSGKYRRENLIFVDGTEFKVGDKPPTSWSEVTFMNVTPYAQRIERGWSPKAPDGVYQATATWAKKFGNIAKIRFEYRTVDGLRNPSIVLRAN
jgi:hypothetical protein